MTTITLFHKTREIIFPEGNRWFYYVAIVWAFAIAIFLISFPAILTSTGYWYGHETGTEVMNGENELINTSGMLYDIALEMWRIFIVFMIVSVVSDMFYWKNNIVLTEGDL